MKTTYRKVIEILEVSNKITKYLKLKKLPHYSTIQKLFVRIPSQVLSDLKDIIFPINDFNCELVAMDKTGHTSDYADKYYAKIRGKSRKSYIKNHIAIDVDTRLILNYSASKKSKKKRY